jgi:hypothetical protein
MVLEILVVSAVGTAAFTGSLMFLPAFIELRHPKDAGPRLINSGMALTCIGAIANMEEEHPINRQLAQMFTGYFPAIPSLEL